MNKECECPLCECEWCPKEEECELSILSEDEDRRHSGDVDVFTMGEM